MQAVTTQVSTKYQVVIPKLVREALGIHPHDSMLFVISGDTVIVRPQPASLTAALRGCTPSSGLTPDAWLEEERSHGSRRLPPPVSRHASGRIGTHGVRVPSCQPSSLRGADHGGVGSGRDEVEFGRMTTTITLAEILTAPAKAGIGRLRRTTRTVPEHVFPTSRSRQLDVALAAGDSPRSRGATGLRTPDATRWLPPSPRQCRRHHHQRPSLGRPLGIGPGWWSC